MAMGSIEIKLTELEVFNALLDTLKDVIKDERIPVEIREEYKNRIFETLDKDGKE